MDFDTLFPVAYFLLLGILYAIGKYFEKRQLKKQKELEKEFDKAFKQFMKEEK